MLILGIETSCDETAAAVVEDGRRILSNVVASQVEIHARYGGVVPEVASRQHLMQIIPVVQQALSQAEISLDQVNAVAVTHGPGLAGSLLVGVNLAKALAYAGGLPLYGVNHLESHIYAAWLLEQDPEQDPGYPLLCLVASGGHTDLVLMEAHGRFGHLGQTRDDAAGEAFDKAARFLGLGYPGGPAIQRAAQGVDTWEELPRARMQGTLDFSFSGVKTALFHCAQSQGVTSDASVEHLAAAFQSSVVGALVAKTMEAVRQTGARGIILGGGVTANLMLRDRMAAASGGLPVVVPPPALCTDNAAMVAACAYFRSWVSPPDELNLDVLPSLTLG